MLRNTSIHQTVQIGSVLPPLSNLPNKSLKRGLTGHSNNCHLRFLGGNCGNVTVVFGKPT